MVKYAAQVSEIINAFSMAALKTNEMDKFYCDDTMEYRTSDKYNSPIEDIFDGCINPGEYNAFLLLGHRGCGKSTELNKMSLKLIDKGYHVKTINCSLDLDLLNIVHSDLFILMGEALLQIAKETGCNISKNILENIRDFWHEGTETITAQETEAASMETGISIETKGIFANIPLVSIDMPVSMDAASVSCAVMVSVPSCQKSLIFSRIFLLILQPVSFAICNNASPISIKRSECTIFNKSKSKLQLIVFTWYPLSISFKDILFNSVLFPHPLCPSSKNALYSPGFIQPSKISSIGELYLSLVRYSIVSSQ